MPSERLSWKKGDIIIEDAQVEETEKEEDSEQSNDR